MAGSSRNVWYNTINPEHTVHPIYQAKNQTPYELHRVSWTRLRLSAHSLAIEEGRWNRRGRGRLPVEERLCSCGRVQDEKHIIEHCPRTEHIRQEHRIDTVATLLTMENYAHMCKICFEYLNNYI